MLIGHVSSKVWENNELSLSLSWEIGLIDKETTLSKIAIKTPKVVSFYPGKGPGLEK